MEGRGVLCMRQGGRRAQGHVQSAAPAYRLRTAGLPAPQHACRRCHAPSTCCPWRSRSASPRRCPLECCATRWPRLRERGWAAGGGRSTSSGHDVGRSSGDSRGSGSMAATAPAWQQPQRQRRQLHCWPLSQAHRPRTQAHADLGVRQRAHKGGQPLGEVVDEDGDGREDACGSGARGGSGRQQQGFRAWVRRAQRM